MKINIVDRVLNADKRHMHTVLQVAKKIDTYQDKMKALSDEALQHKTVEFRNRLSKGEALNDLLVEAYAVVRESALRMIGEYPFFVQLVGGVILHYGDIAQMKTGEGKTLTSTMPIYLNALGGRGVHVVTTNDYLASRDAQRNGLIYNFLGLSVGYNHRGLSTTQKREQFACDITYTTNSELGFDYLRDGMVMRKEDKVLRDLQFALVDEVDSILVDEARTPLIISGGQKEETSMFARADQFVKRLHSSDVEVELKDKAAFLSASGINKAEQFFGVDHLFHPDHMVIVHHVNQSLKANIIMKRDIDYVVKENEVLIVDEYTGRAMEGRNYSNGLHQAIEAKEEIVIKQENSTLATITYQNFFRLYKKLSGMSGTAKTDELEFLETYNMRVMEVATNRPLVRNDAPDLVFATRREKYQACVEDVIAKYEKGQPVLIGTAYIQDSEFMSSLLQKKGIPHEVLNAKNHALEAEIIAKAGQLHSVTIATNMAGRGTDIKLQEGVNDLGGLAILGLQRHESKRIDNQLKGRSGRQGDLGYSLFYVSLEDDLILRHASEEQKIFLVKHMASQEKLRKMIDTIQRTVESEHYYSRKQLLEYDEVMRQQRSFITEQREYIMDTNQPIEVLQSMFGDVVKGVIDSHELEFKKAKDYDEVCALFNKFEGPTFVVEKVNNLDKQEIITKFTTLFTSYYLQKTKDVRVDIVPFERYMILKHLDDAWIMHVDEMLALKDGIHLRSYAQVKPADAYKAEGYDRFKEMMLKVSSEVLENCMQLQIAPQMM